MDDAPLNVGPYEYVMYADSSVGMVLTTVARLYDITDISDEFLALLSHATQVRGLVGVAWMVEGCGFGCRGLKVYVTMFFYLQERLRDVVEQLTVVSRHRTESLKVSGTGGGLE